MGKKVIWKRVVLHGFGCYRNRVEIDLNIGLNNLVAGNEQGKSTLIMGLVAILFGLPNISDPNKFGKAKYRNLTEPAKFEGEIVFSAGGKIYCVRRDFDTDRVLLMEQSGAGWEQLVGGEHRPGARRKNVIYEERLADLIGITSYRLFGSTFCVGQPLPQPERLDEEVQQLLSGTGISGAEALGRLEDWLQEKTRYTAKLGVTSRDKNKDRYLEILFREKGELERNIADSIENIDAQHALQEQINRQTDRKKGLEKTLAEKQDLYKAWEKWLNLRDRYSSAVQEQGKLKQACKEASRLKEQLGDLERLVEQEYPEFIKAPPGLEDVLDTLISVEDEIKGLCNDIDTAKSHLDEQTKEMGELEEQLKGPLAAGMRQPDLDKKHQELIQSLQKLKGWEEALSKLSAEEEEARGVMIKLQAWEALGDRPFIFYRQAAETALERHSAFQAEKEKLQTGNRDLIFRYSMLETGGDDLRAACRDYYTIRNRLDKQLADAHLALDQVKDRLKEIRVEEAKLESQYADIADYPDGMVDVLITKLELEDRKRQLTQEVLSKAGTVRRPILAAGLVLLIAAAATWSMDLPVGCSLALLGIGLAVTFCGLAIGKTRLAPAASKELEKITAEVAKIDFNLGAAATVPLQKLAVIHERLKLRRDRRQEIAEKAAHLPIKSGIDMLEGKVSAADRELKNFNQTLQPILAGFEDPQVAYQGWKHLRDNVEQWKNNLEELTQKRYGLKPGQVDAADPADVEGWREVQVLAGVLGKSFDNIAEAGRWLGAVGAGDWESWNEQAEEYRKAKERLDTCEIQRPGLEERDDLGKTRCRRLEETILSLRQLIHPFTENTPAFEIRDLLEACNQTRNRLGSIKGEIKAQSEIIDKAKKRMEELRPEQQDLVDKVDKVLITENKDPRQARSRLKEWRLKDDKRQQLFSRLKGLLAGWDAGDLEALELKGIDTDNNAMRLRKEWQNLVDSYPGLPNLAMADQREQLHTEYLSLEGSLRVLEKQKKGLEENIFELGKQLSGLLGRKTINIAAAKDLIADLELEYDRIKLETEALALAHRELAEASDIFNATYRDRLAAVAGDYFAGVTNVSGRRVALDDEFGIAVVEPNGQPVKVAQLSQGAQDQLQVVLRLAIADLVSGNYVLPIIFDDPFLNFDEDRLSRIRKMLTNLAERRQILILSHQSSYQHWGFPVQLV